MFSLGGYSIELYHHGYLSLDGGAMFGSVPRPLWERKIPPDEKHRIRLATRSLLLTGHERIVLVDVGCGDKWNDKERSIFAFEKSDTVNPPLQKEDVTDVVITHLHFDHAGGLTFLDENGELQLTYPNARVWLQKQNYTLGKHPNIRERASYLSSHIDLLEKTDLHLVQGSQEILPALWVHQSDGHTEGLQYIEIRGENDKLYYPSDLIPTSHHLPLPYHMGYDMCAEKILKEKEPFLEKVLQEDAIVVFEHDPKVAAVRIHKNDKGHFAVREEVELG